jgi:hypothetical protein
MGWIRAQLLIHARSAISCWRRGGIAVVGRRVRSQACSVLTGRTSTQCSNTSPNSRSNSSLVTSWAVVGW